MERVVTKQVSYGRACMRCRVYFVTHDANKYVCPWCERINSGTFPEEMYENERELA